jgi:asparagine synthetase B (glutamine-hydrolysing)
VGDVFALLDKMTMAVSLERRVPMLDHRVVEFCYSVPVADFCENLYPIKLKHHLSILETKCKGLLFQL